MTISATTRSRPQSTTRTGPRTTTTSRAAPRTRRFGIALGGNLGPSRRTLREAIDLLEERLGPLEVAPIYRTEPVGDRSQPDFLNSVVVGRTSLGAEALLDLLMRLERRFGRRREIPGGPRTLDLDLLFLGRSVRRQRSPLLPHPRLRERRFVLQPLADLVPDLRLPPDGCTPRELLAELPRRPWARLDSRAPHPPVRRPGVSR
ncbi:MAG: 2-amino-4-hydroxy-6-hydroxymethyldihydropteridine diphosphokinase [Thermoanaerobaculia bacterium]